MAQPVLAREPAAGQRTEGRVPKALVLQQREQFGLVPDAISGVITSSPLAVSELRAVIEIPVFDNVRRDKKEIAGMLM